MSHTSWSRQASRPVVRRAVDVVIVGAGVAGLSAALAAAPRRVVLLTKAPGLERGSASVWARGGIAAAVGDDDSPDLHRVDTVAVAGGLADPERVRALVEAAPAEVKRLVDLGARFDRDAAGQLELGREAAHSRHRILHADGDATGREIVRALVEALRRAEHVEVFEGVFVDQLLGHDGRVVGVRAQTPAGARLEVLAPAVVLATGGIGQLWRNTTNPTVATGDGLALALRAGAAGRDLEMMQFHPTALAIDRDPLPLLTEALRGEGATLVDHRGERFLAGLHELAELAPRDFVARTIADRIEATGAAYLDARSAIGARFPERFPTAFADARAAGLDPRVDLLPVTPAAHYHMGGIATDELGISSVPGLLAIGEVASAGVHGANRLASNSLMEGLVMGQRVAGALAPADAAVRGNATFEVIASLVATAAEPNRPSVRPRLRQLAWQELGLIRTGDGLERMLDEVASQRDDAEGEGGEVVALWTVAAAVASAALARQESRGAHQRRDFPTSEASPRSSMTCWSAVEQELESRVCQARRVHAGGSAR